MVPKKQFFYLASVALIIILFYYLPMMSEPCTNHEHVIELKQIVQNSCSNDSEKPLFKSLQFQTVSNENTPEIYFIEKLKKPKNFNKTCAKFPQLYDLKFNNELWQVQHINNGTFYLFNAYVDRREENIPVVRIVVLYTHYEFKNDLYCQFWYNGTDQPTIVQSKQIIWMFRRKWGAERDGLYQPYLISCPLNDNQIPMSVSLVEKPCVNSTNNVKITTHRKFDKRKNFVVCVKGLNFPKEDRSIRLVEWIELLKILGAEKINFYEFAVHPNVKKILDYYVSVGEIEVTPITLAGDNSNHPIFRNGYLHKKSTERRLQEVIPYNDCLYKHLEEFKFVVLLDTDEVIIPAQDTWIELIETSQKIWGSKSFYFARNVYFFDTYQHVHDWFEDIPVHMHMLQHVYRAKNYTKPGYFVKGFHDVDKVQALHNHFPISCYGGCTSKEVNTTMAHLQHYRSDCTGGVSGCKDMKENSVIDTRIWNYKSQLIQKVEMVLKKLNLHN